MKNAFILHSFCDQILFFTDRNLKVNFEDKKAKLEQLMMNKGQKGDALMDFDPKKFEENNEHRNLFEVLEALEADQKYFLMLELKVIPPIKILIYIILLFIRI